MKAVAVALALLLVAGQAGAACRKALAIGMDVSGSVDAREYQLQFDGLAGALADPDVREALLSSPETPVDLVVFEWGGPEFQRIILPWTTIDSGLALTQAIAQLQRAGQRQSGEHSEQSYSQYSGADVMARRRGGDPSTAIGSAMLFGADQLQGRACWTRTLDLSGDGISNTGPDPRVVATRLRDTGLTVNALAIITRIGAPPVEGATEPHPLPSYFRDQVIMGPDAFVESAKGFRDFQQAMTRKLRRELAELAVSELNPDVPAGPLSKYSVSDQPSSVPPDARRQ